MAPTARQPMIEFDESEWLFGFPSSETALMSEAKPVELTVANIEEALRRIREEMSR